MIDELAVLIRRQFTEKSLERITCPACPYQPKMGRLCRKAPCPRMNSEEGSKAMASWMMAMIDSVVEANKGRREDFAAYLKEGFDDVMSYSEWQKSKQ